MDSEDGLQFALIFDGQGGARPAGWEEIRRWTPEQGPLWIHLNYTGAAARRWLCEESGVPAVYTESLLAEETRPRVARAGDALQVTLRGVNHNPGAEPEDMVAVRLWMEARRVISSGSRRLMTIADLHTALEEGQGPRDVAGFLLALAEGLMDHMGPVVLDLDDVLDELEDLLLTTQSAELHARLSDARRTALGLRRYMAPQAEAMAHLQHEETSWLDANHRSHLREIHDQTVRYTEDLNMARERAAVTQDEVNHRLSHQMTRTVYLLTVVATVLLPLNLITGALGINVGGIPGASFPWAFPIVVLLLAGIGASTLWLLRRFKML
ncbi:MAG: zinc transporter ZntB [Candidatus Lambdaproteobacteria bacterium]|nr:zinc transporter ZntB [Candidatus Lambdaproteobacteria bacterium]